MALGGVLSFLVIVVIEHWVNSSLDPAIHRISEYVNGRWGWLMVVGFAAWASSLAATAVWAGERSHGKGPRPPLLVAAIGMLMTACFATQTSAGQLPPESSLTLSGRLHDLGSGISTVALAVAVLLSLQPKEPQKLRRSTLWLLLVTFALWAILLALGDDAAGVRQRLLVVTACMWQLLLLTKGTSDREIARSQASSTSGPSASIR